MDFVNHTPFPAQVFEAIDQFDQEFYVLVLRQTLTFASENMEYADEQAPLCESDAAFEGASNGSVRQESDYCPYKPKCDVIVNAVAHAPGEKPCGHFSVRVVVRRPDRPAPLPEPPRGLNPLMSASPEAIKQWRVRVEKVKQASIPGEVLIDKALCVSGDRHFEKRTWPARLLQSIVKWGTLTLIRPSPWKLTRPREFTSLPMRAEYAYGGECRINTGDPAAVKVGKTHRLTPEQLAGHPDCDGTPNEHPVAHTICDSNPSGCGYTEHWFLKATGAKLIKAPRIELVGQALTAKGFWRALSKPLAVEGSLHAPVPGIAIRSKLTPARSALLGTVTPSFVERGACLPEDFDFAIWNAAPLDQQIEFPCGDEVFELINLCRTRTPGSFVDSGGNVVLRLLMPAHECFATVIRNHERLCSIPLHIDTVIIEPETYSVSLVWRATVSKDDVGAGTTFEFRMRTLKQREREKLQHSAYQRWNAPAKAHAQNDAKALT